MKRERSGSKVMDEGEKSYVYGTRESQVRKYETGKARYHNSLTGLSMYDTRNRHPLAKHRVRTFSSFTGVTEKSLERYFMRT